MANNIFIKKVFHGFNEGNPTFRYEIYLNGKHYYNFIDLSDIESDDFSSGDLSEVKKIYSFVSFIDWTGEILSYARFFSWGVRLLWHKGDRLSIDIPYSIGITPIMGYSSLIGFNIDGQLTPIQTKENVWGEKQPRFIAKKGGSTELHFKKNAKELGWVNGEYKAFASTNGRGNYVIFK